MESGIGDEFRNGFLAGLELCVEGKGPNDLPLGQMKIDQSVPELYSFLARQR